MTRGGSFFFHLFILSSSQIYRYPNELVLEGYEESAAIVPPPLSQKPAQTDFFADWEVDPALNTQKTSQPAAAASSSGPLRFAVPGGPPPASTGGGLVTVSSLNSNGFAPANGSDGSSVNTSNSNYGKFISTPRNGFL